MILNYNQIQSMIFINDNKFPIQCVLLQLPAHLGICI